MGNRKQVLFVRFDERSRRENHFVVHLKRNSLVGSRPFGNETSECGLTRFTFRCPNTVGNFLEWSVPDYEAMFHHDESNERTCPLSSSLPRGALQEAAGPGSFVQRICVSSATLYRKRFYRNAFVILSHPKCCLSRRDFYMLRIFVLGSTVLWKVRSLEADEKLTSSRSIEK